MKTKFLFIWILIMISLATATAQNSYLKGRWNIKSGISFYPQRSDHDPKPINLRFEANYGVGSVLEAGVYLGIGRYTYWLPLENNSRTALRTISPFYGIQTNFHLLPLFIKKNDFRFDFYLTGKYGGNYLNIPKGSDPQPGHHTEYSFGGGLAFYLWKHTGFYFEYSIGKYSYYTSPMGYDFENGLNPNLRFGVTFKYKNQPPNKIK
jgi:hypothetical protein